MIKAEDILKISEDNLDALVDFDSQGFLISPAESASAFKDRVKKIFENLQIMEEALRKSQNFDLEGICTLSVSDRIPPEIMAEASQATNKEYDFELTWAPGFFMSKSLGLFWGGCAILIPEICTTVFLIRSAFRKKNKWLFYRRDELLAHELCHSARMPIGDRIFDENFAYRISPSALRRRLGGSFRNEFDAIFFIAPVFLLLTIQLLKIFSYVNLPIFPFWFFALFYPSFLIIRNFIAEKKLAKAASNLSACSFSKPYAVLFRCTAEEISAIASIREPQKLKDWLDKKSDLRWKVISKKFKN